jgi:hypothetical protein
MSYMDNFRKALRKKLEEEENIAPVSGRNVGSGAVRNAIGGVASRNTERNTSDRISEDDSEDSFMDRFYEKLAEIKETEQKIDDRMTVGQYAPGDSEPVRYAPGTSWAFTAPVKEEERTWFQKGAFEDGYQFGDVTKTILGTITDFGQEMSEGIAEMPENIIDTAAMILGSFGSDEFQDKMDAFAQKDLYDAEALSKNPLLGAVNPALLPLFLEKMIKDESVSVDVDDYSAIGERTESLANSVGQMVATRGLQAYTGIPWWVTTGVTSFGSEAENALNQGATHNEAVGSAAISAGAEILSEKLFGGSGLGEKGWINLDPLTKGITNKVVKVLADYGLDIVTEGSEEVVSQIFSNLGSALYREENLVDILTNEEALDGYLESFISGGALGGIMNVGKVSNSVNTGRDYRTGLTENEQKVFDQIYEERLEEAGKDHELSKNEKAEIYDELMEDIEKGYLPTDDIERILGGESYEAYKTEADKVSDLRAQQEALQKEYEELGNKSNATLIEQYKFNELQRQIWELQTKIDDPQSKANRNLLQAQLSQNVYEQTKNDRLRESYFERVRSDKKYQADLSKYKGKAREVIMQVMDSGLADDSNRTHEFWDIAAKMADGKGMDISIADQNQILDMLKAEHEAKGLEFDASKFDGQLIDGYTDGKKIVLNAETKRGLNFVVGHEITHTLEGTKHYDAFQKLFMEYAKGEYQSRYEQRSGQYSNKFAADEKFRSRVNKEVTADLVGDYLFNDKNFVTHLAKNRNVFQAVWDEIKYLAKIATAGSQQARQLEKVKREFERAWREAGKAQGDTKLSVSDKSLNSLTIDDLLKMSDEEFARVYGENGLDDYLELDSDILDYDISGISEELNAEPEAVKILYRRNGLGGSHVEANRKAVMTQERIDQRIAEHGAGQSDYARRYITQIAPKDFIDMTVYEDNMNRDNFDNRVRGDHNGKMGDWDYDQQLRDSKEPPVLIIDKSTGRIIGHNGRHRVRALEMAGIESVEIEVELHDEDGYLIKYNAQTIPDMAISSQFDTAIETHISNIIPFNKAHRGEIVANYGEAANADAGVKYSVSDEYGDRSQFEVIQGYTPRQTDSDGIELSDAQQEYFKDSKMRDEQGNLKVMYHGSQDAGFHVFDARKSDDDISFFFVDRNDVAATYSGSYETYEARAFTTAEDANKFFERIGKTEYQVVEKNGKYALIEDGGRTVFTVAESDSVADLYEEFCDYEGVGYGDANYKVYLNLTNPLEVDAQGRNWNNVSREFSQEVYDRYQSLTAEEKAALTDLAEWGEYGVFKDEMLDSAKRGGNEILFSAYEKLGGANANLYDAFTIASDNFSEESLREFAAKQMTTRDYAQRAKAEGYDGVIFKNIVDNGGYSNGSEGASTVAIAFESNQIKSVANENPTGDADIRYSVSDAPINKITNDGLTMTYVRVPNQNTQYYGSRYGQNIEPAGEYMSMDTMQGKYKIDGYEYGTIQFKKPLVLEHINTSDKGWKKTVSDMYGGLTGKALTKALVKDGYDAIVTYDEYGYNEVVNLNGKKLDDAKNIRFSLSEAVEETKDLIAMHNLQGEQLLRSLELGGLPMPSIAIIKAEDSHNDYGEVSLILHKEAIDPQFSRYNKVYGGDAWTPTYPKIEYKPNAKVDKKISDKYYELARQVGYDKVRPMYSYVHELEDALNRVGGESALLKELYDDTDMMNVYLLDSGKGMIDPIEKETRTEISPEQAEMNQYFIDALGEDIISGFKVPDGERPMTHRMAFMEQQESKIRDAYQRFFMELYDFSEAEAENAVDNTSRRDLVKIIRDAYMYTQNKGVTIRTEIDSQATQKAIREAAADGYKGWVDGLFKGVEEKTGIRNNQDYYTRSGNPRSWDALHWENTLENVVKVMRQQQQVGTGTFFGGTAIFPVAAKNYQSIAEIKADSHRLRKATDEEYEAIKESYAQRFQAIAERVASKRESNRFIAWDNAMEAMVDAVRVSRTVKGVYKELKGYSNLNVTEKDAADILALVADIAEMPTGYFEAKPQRAVGFDEVGVFVIPNNADVKLKQELLNRGYAIAEYDPNVEGHRQQVVNQFEEYKFSLSDIGQEQKRGRGWYVPSHYNPVQTEVAPTQTEVAPQENLPTIEFPDDLAPVQAELESLIEEEAEMRSVMEGYAGVNDIDAVNRLLPEYEAIQERIRVLQQSEAERTGSITDADAPVEMTREYDTLPDSIPLNKDATEWITGNVVAALGLDGKQKKNVRSLIQKYSDNQLSREQLYEAVREQFGTYKETEVSEELKDVKAKLRTYGINVSDSIKSEIPDYNDLRKRYFGKVRFSKQGLAVDEAYREFMEVMPGYFNEDLIGNPTDQFMRILEVADADPKSEIVREVDAETLQDATDAIIEGVNDFRQIQKEKDSEVFAREGFDSLIRDANLSAPIGENAETVKPVIGEHQTFLPTAEAKTTKSGQVPGQKAIAKEFIQGESDRTAEIVFGRDKSQAKKLTDWQWAQEHIFRHGAAVEDLALATGNPELQARFDMIRRAESMAQHFIGKGDGNVKALLDIRKAVEDAGKTRPFNYYLYHMLNVDRMTLEERFGEANKAVFGDTTTAEDSRQAAANLLRMNPQFKQWADQIYAITKHMREQMVNGGVISRETADWLEKKYPHYVPINRVFHDGKGIDVPLDTKRTGVNSPIKKAEGGDSNFDDAFDILASRIEQTYKAVAKNRFGVELKNTLRSAIEAETADAESVVDDVGFHEELLQEGKNGEKPTFTVFEGGKRVKFEITNDLYEAMKPSQFTWTNPVLNKLNNARRDILTTYSPTFMLTNPIKDIGDIVLNSQHPVRTYAEIPEAIWEVITKGKWYQERMKHGGDQDTFFDSQKRLFKKEPRKFVKIIGFPIEKLNAVNEGIEQIPRIAEYIASRKMGRSIDVSMLDAARVTTNFGASGDFTNMINRNGFTFLSASVEGFNQQVRNVREAKAEGLKGWAKLAGKYLAAGLPAMLLNHLLWDDDEEYAELSDYVKQNYYIVAKFGDDTFLRIPKGRAVAVIQDAFQQMENFITGNDEVDLGAFAQLVVNNLAPNNPLDNNIIAPIAQAWSNTTWYGDDLVPTRLQDVPTAEQYDETTDAISRWLGERTNISPYKWNYILDQYSGGIGDIFLPYFTPEQDGGGFGAALRDKFTTNSTMNNQNVSDFYDLLEELTVNANASTATDEDELMSKYMNSINSELSKLYQKKRKIQNMDIPDADKYGMVKDIQEQIVALMKEGMANYQGISYEDDYRGGGTYARVADRLYELTDEGEWKKLTDEQVTKYEVTKAAGDAAYATDGTNHYRWYEPEEGSESEPGWRKVTDKELERQEEITSGLGISPEEYWEKREEYSYAYEHPESYAVAQAVGGYDAWMKYSEELYDIKADKDEYGKSISGSRKDHVIDYLNGLDADYYTKIILFKSEYNADDTYNEEIIDYLNSREDISYAEMEAILKKLGFYVDAQGNISW